MGMKVLSLFDGMSCGHLALDKAEIDVDTYVASEVKEFAINHTDRKYPDTIKAGDVTKLHYENGKLYRNCKRWVLVKDKNVVPFAQRLKNKDCFKVEGNREFVDVTSLVFDMDFDKNNRMLADYKDEGLVLNASTLSNEEVDEYKQEGFEILPNGEIAKWEIGECIFEGEFDMLIGGSPCFTADTPVLTSEGYKPIVDVKVGDRVVSHDGKLHNVVAFMPQGEKHIFEVNTAFSGILRTTINHEFYVREKRRVGKKSIRVFDDPRMVAVGDFAENCKDYYIGFPINQNEIVPTWNGIEVFVNQNTSKNVCELNVEDENLWYLVGRYLGDGWLKKRSGKYRAEDAGVVVCCGNKKVEDFKNKIAPYFHYSVDGNYKGCKKFTFCSVELAAFMKQFGEYSDSKFLPGFVYDMPVNLLKALFQGYLDSDGSYIKKQNEWKFTSVNKNLLLGMGALLAKIYHRPYSLTEVKVSPITTIEGRVVKQKNWYQLKWHFDERKQDHMFYENGYIWGPIRFVKENGVEDVYDITVDETHTFVASNVMVHNCQNFSLASATNDEKYGLEGSKSRLFFDYLRLKMEVSPKYFFLENVNMKKDSKDMLDDFLGVKGISMNSDKFSIQSRPRIYWTNLVSSEPTSSYTNEETDFQRHMLRTLEKFEYALYVKRFPGSYFGYADGTPEKAKGGFVFDDKVSSTTNRLGDVVEGTKEDIERMVTFDENNQVVISLTNEDVDKIANMPCNQWARKELEDAYGPMSDVEFVEEIHKQLYDAIVKKSPSRDGMRYGKVVNGKIFSHCKDITNESKMSCITRKQDRFPNSGLIKFGPYCRFVTKIEICKGQTVPYKFLEDLSYEQVQDVCGDGWTVDVIAAFFENVNINNVYNEENVHTINKEESCNKKEGEESMSKEKVADVFDQNEVENEGVTTSNANDGNVDNNRNVGRGKYKVKTFQMGVPDDPEAIAVVRKALRPWEKDYVPENDAREVEATAEDVLAIVKREFGEDAYEKIRYELFGWDKVKKERKVDAPSYVVERVANEVRDAIKNGTPFTEELKEKALWLL